MLNQHGPNCKQEEVGEQVCYLRFGPQEVAGAAAVRWETVRGETLVIDLSDKSEVVGIEIISPGMKPCQPPWNHLKPIDPTKLPPEGAPNPPLPFIRTGSANDDEEEDNGEGNQG